MNTIDISERGACPNGSALCTEIINSAIREISAAGGGTIIIPAGRFLTGTVYLQSRVTLKLTEGATLLGSTELADYPENAPPVPTENLEFGRFALVYAEDAEEVAIQGPGTICGQGSHTNFNKKDRATRGWNGRDAYLKRPYGLQFTRCRRVLVDGIHLVDLAFWVQDYLDCDDVVVRGVSVDSRKFDYNNDGIDIDGSRDVRVSDCRFNTGDDGICLKASYRDCERITVTNCIASTLANGIKFGTATNAGFRNIAISNCVVHDTGAAGLALEIVDGGILDGVTVTNLAMSGIGVPVFIRLGDRGRRWRLDSPERMPIGRIRNVLISNITARVYQEVWKEDRRAICASITGLPGHPVEDIVLRDIRIVNALQHTQNVLERIAGPVPEQERDYPEFNMFGELPAQSFYCRHVKGLVFDGLDVSNDFLDYRPGLVCDDVEGLSVRNSRFQTVEGGGSPVDLRDVRDVAVLNLGFRGPAPTVSVKTRGVCGPVFRDSGISEK